MKKAFIALVVLAGFGFLGWQIYEKATGQNQNKQRRRLNPPVAVEIAPVQKTTITEIGRFAGSLNPKSSFIVAPKIAGRLETIKVDIGDSVQAGMLLAKIDDQEYLQQVSQAEAELEVAKANLSERRTTLDSARRELSRTEALRKKKIASESELDTARSTYKAEQAKLDVAQAQVKQKKASLATAKVRLSYTKIRMPANQGAGKWVVGQRFIDEGAMLAANTPIASVLDIGTLTAVIFVIERDYPKIHPMLEALITTDAFPAKTFPGRVARIAPLITETSREARIEIEVPNQSGLLKPGMFVRAEIAFERRQNATVVPTAAIVKRDGREGLFLADKGRAHFVPVTRGIVNGPQSEILKPPISGSVVILGHHLLAEGSPIVLGDKKAAGASIPQSGRAKKR